MSTLDTDSTEHIFDDPAASHGHHRLLGALATTAITVLGLLLVLTTGSSDWGTTDVAATAGSGAVAEGSSGIPPSRLVLSHLKLRDTVYTTDSVYLEVNLTKQNVTVHRRDGTQSTFLVSSGNPHIREGMSTPPGIFTVQNMTPMALSRQFNNARLHNWIGVQGGIGFHGLDGSGYYGYLGVRPSSHGCLRMAREAIKEMYSMVHPGALIMVHNGDPARVVAFCEARDTVGAELIDSASVYSRSLGKERFETMMQGRAFVDPRPRLVHLAKQRLRWGMEIGRGERIPRQRLPESFSMADAGELLAVADASLEPPVAREARREAERRLALEESAARRESDAKERSAEPEYGE